MHSKHTARALRPGRPWLPAAACLAAALTLPARAIAQTDTLTLGAAVSLTGKYATNGKNTLDGYQLAVKRINEMGGVVGVHMASFRAGARLGRNRRGERVREPHVR